MRRSRPAPSGGATPRRAFGLRQSGGSGAMPSVGYAGGRAPAPPSLAASVPASGAPGAGRGAPVAGVWGSPASRTRATLALGGAGGAASEGGGEVFWLHAADSSAARQA